MEKQKWVIVWELYHPQWPLHNVPKASPQQWANLPRWQIRLADGDLCPLQQGVSHHYHLQLPLGAPEHLSLSHWRCSIGWHFQFLISYKGSQPFCNCKSSDGAGAFLLMWEVTNFQLSSWLERPLSNFIGRDSSCPSTTTGDLGSGSCRDLEESQSTSSSSFLMLCNLLTSSYCSFLWWHRCSATAHFLQARRPCAPASARGPRHFQQPETCRAASLFWSCLWVQDSSSERTASIGCWGPCHGACDHHS